LVFKNQTRFFALLFSRTDNKMAIITKIRERAGLAAGIVALSLGLFVVGSDLLTSNSSLFSNKQIVGEINGDKITLEEYQKEIGQLEYDYAVQQGKNPGEQEMQGIREQAWNQLIFKKVFLSESENVGVEVSDDEKIDMVQGKNIHQAIKSTFVDQTTKEFNKSLVENFLKNIDQAQPQQKAAWYNFEAKLPEDRIRTKYEALLTKTNYVTTAEAKREYESQSAKGDFEYVYVPFSSIVDSTIKVSDDELKDYLKGHQYKYKSQDTRSLEYVQFMIQPSKDDSAYFQNELSELKAEFEKPENDTAFAKARTDGKDSYKSMNVSEMPKELTSDLDAIQKGGVYGPYLSGATYTLYKLIDKINEGDSYAKASHILFKPNSPDDTAKAGAKKRAQAVLARIKKGESFEEMARIYGTDGTASQGGDLGWFGENKMVKPFQDAVFNFPSKGLLSDVVETDFGYHIIKVTEPKTNLKYKVANIARNISAGDATKDAIYRQANEFKSKANTQAEFDSAVKKNNKLMKMTAQSLQKNSTYVNDIPEARNLVIWAFSDEEKIGAIKLYEFNDRYVVALKTKETNEGEAKLEDVKDMVKIEVIKQKKAAQIIAKLKGKTVQEMATAYGQGAVSNVAPGISLSASNIGDFGYDPLTVGAAMGLKPNVTSKPLTGENGVGVIKMTNFTPAPETKDFSSYKTQIEQKYQSRGQYYITEALKEIVKVKDNRVKFM
jgi:peptidyl-prolyl cis-trans isomerase D